MVAAAGCGGMTSAPVVATSDEAQSKNASDYENTYAGLCNYLLAHGYINPLEDNKNITFTEMDYSLVGASQGNKFTCQMEGMSNVTIEIYDFTKSASPDEVYNSVKKDGKFSILGLDEVNAYLSDNGKYMMIYTDSNINWNNPDKNSKNYKTFEEFLKLFKEFHK